MFARIILAVILVSTVASAKPSSDERRPGRCVVITESDRATRLVCDVPPSEGCAEATIVMPDGAIITKRMCVQPLASR